jgi:starch-binding outer membrane protein, SusD/RagB family
MSFKRIKVCAVALLTMTAAACDLDLSDPNVPPEEDVLTAVSSVLQVGIGLQAEYSNQFGDPVITTGMVTNELGANTATFESYRIIDTGSGPATNDLGPATLPWPGMYRVVRHANTLIETAPNVGLGPGTVSGLLAMAKLYKAMAFGNLIQIYERIPIVVGPTVEHPTFAQRAEVYAEIIRLLEEAAAHLQQTPASAEFNAQVLAPGFNLPNTIQAMLARYALIAGDLAKADAAAAAVNLNVFSEFRFSANDANPFWNTTVNGGNSTSLRPKDKFRVEAEPGDGRVAYWVTEAPLEGFAAPLDNFNRYSDRTHSHPAYLPGEIRLIRAEVAARQNRLADALVFVNEVRTQCSSPVPEPLACLPALTLADVPTQAAMLDEILEQRRYELYLQHLRWSDLRRFGKPVKYQWMPVPITECGRNQNVPNELCQPQPANPAGWD